MAHYVYNPRVKTLATKAVRAVKDPKHEVQAIISTWTPATSEDIKDIEHDTDFKMSRNYKIYKHPDYKGKMVCGCQYERLLFHGSRTDNVKSILSHGIDLDRAKSGMFGDGMYFADRWSKSFNYTDGHFMLVYAVRDDKATHILDEVDRQTLLIRVTKKIKKRELKRNPIIPMVHAVQSKEGDMHHFLYNDEWCVYDETLCRLAYIISM